ncbi:hypothetical protein GGF46_001472 [Coemansia sp. RSA 552]|nr:hypothetical protein GGF46_001472 [Coemansia sp. RSA 552]
MKVAAVLAAALSAATAYGAGLTGQDFCCIANAAFAKLDKPLAQWHPELDKAAAHLVTEVGPAANGVPMLPIHVQAHIEATRFDYFGMATMPGSAARDRYFGEDMAQELKSLPESNILCGGTSNTTGYYLAVFAIISSKTAEGAQAPQCNGQASST